MGKKQKWANKKKIQIEILFKISNKARILKTKQKQNNEQKTTKNTKNKIIKQKTTTQRAEVSTLFYLIKPLQRVY